MAKNKQGWNEQKLNQFLREGRGQGIGNDYKPWLTIQDFPSQGRVSRIFGWKSSRIHHFFSDLQARYFYLLEWQDNVIDIREHFPLLDIHEVIKGTEDLRLEKFIDKETQTPYVLTTTFLITTKGNIGDRCYLARSVKMASELEKRKTLERLEIERRYWEAKGIDWGIVTQKEIPTNLTKNISWVHPTLYSFKERGFTEEEVIYLGDILIERFKDTSHSIRKITADFDSEFNYESGTGLFLFKYLIASKKIEIEMEKPLDINRANVVIISNQNQKGGLKKYVGGQ